MVCFGPKQYNVQKELLRKILAGEEGFHKGWLDTGKHSQRPVPCLLRDLVLLIRPGANANCHQPTTNRQPPPTANHCSILFLWSCVLPMSCS